MGNRLVAALQKFVQLFILLGDRPYARSNLVNLRVIWYHQRCGDMPFTEMFKSDIGLFSEEAGELLFGALGRHTVGDHTAEKFKHVDKIFCSLAIYSQIRHLEGDDASLVDSSFAKVANNFDDSVAATVEFFKTTIRALKRGCLQMVQ